MWPLVEAGRSQLSHKKESCGFLPGKPGPASPLSLHPPGTCLGEWCLVVGWGADTLLPAGEGLRQHQGAVERLSELGSLHPERKGSPAPAGTARSPRESPPSQPCRGGLCTPDSLLGAITCHFTMERDSSLFSSANAFLKTVSGCDINPLRKPRRGPLAKP